MSGAYVGYPPIWGSNAFIRRADFESAMCILYVDDFFGFYQKVRGPHPTFPGWRSGMNEVLSGLLHGTHQNLIVSAGCCCIGSAASVVMSSVVGSPSAVGESVVAMWQRLCRPGCPRCRHVAVAALIIPKPDEECPVCGRFRLPWGHRCRKPDSRHCRTRWAPRAPPWACDCGILVTEEGSTGVHIDTPVTLPTPESTQLKPKEVMDPRDGLAKKIAEPTQLKAADNLPVALGSPCCRRLGDAGGSRGRARHGSLSG